MTSNRDDSFILQSFYVKDLAENFVLRLTVPGADVWWDNNDPKTLAERFE